MIKKDNFQLTFAVRTTYVIIISLILFIIFSYWQSPGNHIKEGFDSVTTFAYYPSLHKLEINIGNLDLEPDMTSLELTALVRLKGEEKVIARQQFNITEKGGHCLMGLPALKDGTYLLTINTDGDRPVVERSFLHKNFPWLGNDLGKSNKVYPPYEPIRVNDRKVNVVMRSYKMNGFGLWDSVISEGKELLTGPVELHLVTDKGEIKWNFIDSKWITQSANKVIYEAVAETPSVRIKTMSTIEYDGAMKVELEMIPGQSGENIQALWLEIPMKNSEAPLFHYSIAPEIRRNYSGATPHGGKITWMSFPGDTDPPTYPRGAKAPIWKAEPGSEDGIIWTNRDIRPWLHVWKTDFVPYFWLGGGTRGIAWFGASPRNYKVDSNGIMQRIIRDGNTLRIKVDLINKPGKLARNRKVIFGMQASPTKPMPDNWRSNVAIPAIDVGVHCAPYGAHGCSDKYPDDANFQVVDEILKVRKTGILDTDVFKELDAERSPHFRSMTNHQDTTWLAWVLHDAGVNQAFALEGDDAAKGYLEGALLVPYRYHVDGGKHEINPIWKDVSKDRLYPDRVAKKVKNAPLAIYFEEHASTIVNEEWVVYQDEWRGMRVQKTRSNYVDEPPKAINNFGVGRQGFPPSYRDFALWYANKWMKRGISIYCDNVYLHMQDNPLTSEAFIDDEGDLQPAARLWDLREYHKRMWVLAQEWNSRNPPYPIMIIHHMTNSLMLPVHTWNDVMLDLEYPVRGRKVNPYSPEYLLAQATGHQTGSYRHLLESVLRIPGWVWFKESVDEMDSDIVRMEWGMRMVHEAMRWLFPHENYAAFEPARTLEKALWEFGYGTQDCDVINYWNDDSPISVSNPDVKWLLMKKYHDKSLFLVLQSYENEDTPVEIVFDGSKLGFTPAPVVHDVEFNSSVKPIQLDKNLQLDITLHEPYGTMVLIIGESS